MENDVVVTPQQIISQVKSDLYASVKLWLVDFEAKARREPEGSSLRGYYTDAASGLAIALQEIDRDRYDRELQDRSTPSHSEST